MIPTASMLARGKDNRELIIDNYFAKGELMMLFAPTGAGKTFNALNMGLSLACGGSIFNNPVISSHRVLYLDGEMGSGAIGLRLKHLMESRGISEADNLMVLSPDYFQDFSFPNLSLEHNQKYFENLISQYGIEILILDNYNTLTNDQELGDNEFLLWSRLEAWLKKLKNQGISVILIHHTNKQGIFASGTVKKDNLMDVILKLSLSPLAEKGETLIEVDFEKSRWTEKLDKKLLKLVKTKDGAQLVQLNYTKELEERVLEMYEDRGLDYVVSRLKIPNWVIKDICDIKPRKQKSDERFPSNEKLPKDFLKGIF